MLKVWFIAGQSFIIIVAQFESTSLFYQCIYCSIAQEFHIVSYVPI